MKKQLKLIEVRLAVSNGIEKMQLSFTDYEEPKEPFDPKAEMQKRILAQLPKDLPPDVAKMVSGVTAEVTITESQGPAPTYNFYPIHYLTLSKKEYAALGSPSVGTTIDIEVLLPERIEHA